MKQFIWALWIRNATATLAALTPLGSFASKAARKPPAGFAGVADTALEPAAEGRHVGYAPQLEDSLPRFHTPIRTLISGRCRQHPGDANAVTRIQFWSNSLKSPPLRPSPKVAYAHPKVPWEGIKTERARIQPWSDGRKTNVVKSETPNFFPLKHMIALSFAMLSVGIVFGQSRTGAPADTSAVTLGEVVITENRLQIPFSKQNRNIQIISREEIAASPAHSVNELLSYVAGIDVRQRGPWGAQADIGIDGGTFDQTLVLVNGIKMSDPQTGHNSLSLPIPTDAIERIEIIRGPAARIYGINSLTGAINIVTRKATESGLDARIHAGSSFRNDQTSGNLYNSRGVQLGGRVANPHGGHLIYGSYDGGNGYRHNTSFLNTKFFYQGETTLDKTDALSWTAGYVYNDFGANGFYAAPGDSNSQEIIQTAIGSVQYHTQLNERWTLAPRVAYRFAYDDYRYLKNDLSRFRNLHRSHVLSYEVNSRYHGRFGDLGFGAELRNDRIRSTGLGNRNRFNYGFYGEFRTDGVDKLSLSFGAFLNYNSDFGWRLYPGLDAGYQFAGNWKVFFNTGTGQRIPTFTDLYYQGAGNQGNPNLVSEHAYYVEGGLKHIGQQWFLTASYFYRRTDDFIDWTRQSLDDPWIPDNFLQNSTKGINVAASYLWGSQHASHVRLGMSYNYLDPKFKQYEADNLSRYAIENLRHQAIGFVRFQVGKFGFTAAERFVERISYRSYFLTDARAALTLRGYQLYVDANNIFDKQYIEAAAIRLPGRWFSLGLKYGI